MFFERGDISQRLLVEIGRVLRRDVEAIIQKWLDSISPGDAESPAHRDQLRDHLPQFIAAVGKDLADGNFDEDRKRDTLAVEHGKQRWDIGWRLEDVVEDYQALRYVMISHLRDEVTGLTIDETLLLGHELDQAIKVAVTTYVQEQDKTVSDLENRNLGLFEAVPIGVAHLSLQGKWLRINDTFCVTVCRSKQELERLKLTDIVRPENATALAEGLAQLARGTLSEYSTEQKFVSNLGATVWTHLDATRQNDVNGEPTYLIVSVQDLSQRQLLQERLNQAEQTADAAIEVKNQFLANVSHELRTPLNSIIRMTQLALSEDLADEIRDYLETSRESADVLLQLVNQVLDVSKLDSGQFQLQRSPFQLRQTLEETLKALANQAFSKGLELACIVLPNVPELLIGDALRLRQIVTNLVSNAIKFTSEGDVLVRVELAERRPKSVYVGIRVCDTGEGIPQAQLTNIFAPFVRVDGSSTRQVGGAGLGLAIVSRLVDRMAGKIELESQVELGTKFTIHIPFDLDTAAANRNLHDQQVDLLGRRILIVDDNPVSQFAVQTELESWNADVTSVSSVAEAFELLQRTGRQFDFSFVDAIMPDVDGFDFLDQVTESDVIDLGKTILMLSASDYSTFRHRILETNGAPDVIEKPILRPALVRALRRLAENGPTSDGKPTTSSVRPLRVLVAEDIPANTKVAVRVLEKAGHRVDAVVNGREAVEQVQRASYDIVLMDVQMPIMDGLQATRDIRRREKTASDMTRIPIVAMTANAMVGDRDACLEAGMDDYVSKPIDIGILLETIDRVTRSTKLQSNSTDQEGKDRADVVFDLDDALRRMRGDRTIVREMISLFMVDYPKLLANIRRGMEVSDARVVERAAHSLKGLADNLSASRTAGIAGNIERLAIAGSLSAIPNEVDRLTDEIESLIPMITEA